MTSGVLQQASLARKPSQDTSTGRMLKFPPAPPLSIKQSKYR